MSERNDDIARLVRLAGKRRAVPEDRAQRVREAARAEWRRGVRDRSRRRWSWAAAGLAAAAVLVLAIGIGLRPPAENSAPRPGGATRVVAVVSGSARLDAGAVTLGEIVPAGAEIVTAADGIVALELASGHSLRLAPDTAVFWREAASLELRRGTIYVDSGTDASDRGAVTVHTPYGIVEEIGTQFELRLDDETIRVRLREGAVVVHRDSGRHEVKAGNELKLAMDGSVARRAIPPYGPEWEWIVEAAPMLELEGRSAREFLDWIARERGFKLAFADEKVARAADRIILSGTASRMTIAQALDAVLPTCRMNYRIEAGVLVVDAEPGE